ALLNITASSYTIFKGAAVPVVTPIITGLQPGDTQASLVGLTCSTTYTPTSALGSYPTTCSGAVNTNYVITYVSGTVSVNSPAAQLISPTPGSVFPGSSVTFNWTTGTGVTTYQL